MNGWTVDKHKDNVCNKKVWGWTIWKVKYLQTRAKVYFLGLQLLTIPLKNEIVKKTDNFLETQLLQVRSFDIICKRSSKNYNRGL